MSKKITLGETKTRLSQLVERAAISDEILIAETGAKPRLPGALTGKISIAPDFDASLPDDIAFVFRGEAA